ncbi:MAG TPA: hypothetical protein VGI81_14585 [Tepidisphaeraceae bacterium]
MSEASQLPEEARDIYSGDSARREYLEGINSDYQDLRGDPVAWADFRQELSEWDVTNTDGLEDV